MITLRAAPSPAALPLAPPQVAPAAAAAAAAPADVYQPYVHQPGLRIPTETIRCALLWMTGAGGAIVFIEPSPYEILTFLSMVVFVAGGLTMSRTVLPMAVLLVLVNIGYSIGGATVIGPLLVGLDRPVQIVPLGAKDATLVNMAALAAFNVGG